MKSCDQCKQYVHVIFIVCRLMVIYWQRGTQPFVFYSGCFGILLYSVCIKLLFFNGVFQCGCVLVMKVSFNWK